MSTKTDVVPKEPVSQPLIDKIAEMLRPGGEMEAAEKRQQGGMSAISKIFEKIQKDFFGHRGAVRALRSLQKKDDPELADYMRTFIPGLLALGLVPEPDMLERVQAMSNGASTDDDDEDDDADKGGDGDGPKSGMDLARESMGFHSNLENAKNHLQAGTKEPTGGIVSPAQQAELDAKNKKIATREAAETKKAATKPKLGIVPSGEARH